MRRIVPGEHSAAALTPVVAAVLGAILLSLTGLIILARQAGRDLESRWCAALPRGGAVSMSSERGSPAGRVVLAQVGIP